MAEGKVFKVRDKESGKVYSVREKQPDVSANKDNVSHSKKPTLSSEAGKVAGQFATGLSQDLLDVGNKPISELTSGSVGSNMELGALMTSNLPDRIKSFAMAGALSADIPQQETMHSKFGFPVPPQPETKVGKILGLGARITGQAITGKLLYNSMKPSSNLKLPKSSQVEQAISKVDENVGELIKDNAATISREADRAKTSKLFRDIQVNDELGNLELQKRNLSDQQAIKVQNKLAIKASSELNKNYAEKYKPAIKGKFISYDDYKSGLEEVLTENGIIDSQGNEIPGIKISKSDKSVLNLYKDAVGNKPNELIRDSLTNNIIGEKDINPRIPLDELDSKLESILIKGRQYGSGDHVLTDIRHKFTGYVAEIKEIGKEFAPDYQQRNAVFDKFKPNFTRIGYRRGDADVSSGIGVLENLSDENPAKVFPQNQRMMDFLQTYGGEDPSHPVKKVSLKIKGLKTSAADTDMRSMFSMDEMASKIKNSETQAIERAKQMKANLGGLLERVKAKEATLSRNKRIALEIAGITGATEAVRFALKKAVGK